MYALQPGPAIKIGIEAQDRSDFMALDDSNVDRIASRKQSTIKPYFAGAQNIRFVNWENVVDDVECQLKSRSDCFSFINGRVPMQNLLKHLCIRNQPLPGCNQSFE